NVEQFKSGRDTARKTTPSAMTVGLRKNGEEFSADASISRLRVGERTIVTVSIRDGTEPRRIEAAQRFFAEVGRVLGSSLDYEKTLTNIVRLVVRDLADFAALYVLEEGGDVRRVRAASHDLSISPWFTELAPREAVTVGADHQARRVTS